MAEHENSIGASDDWHTPSSLLDPIGLTYDLDPWAPLDRSHYFVRARKVFTMMDDGLHQRWDGLVFVNPPFGTRCGHLPWLHKFFDHCNGVAICRAYTSSWWFHKVVLPRAETLLFPKGKTKFVRPDGSIGTAPGHGIALVGMGEIANAALERSGLGWFVSLHRTAQPSITQKILKVPIAETAPVQQLDFFEATA